MLEYAINQGYSALDAQAWRDKLDGFAVVSGLGVSVDSGLTVSIASGTATVGETSGSVDTVSLGSSTTKTLDTANPDNPRKDSVYIDTTGTVQVEKGVAEAADPTGNTRFNTFQPEPPLPSTDGTVLAEVWVGAADTSLESADIRDRRVPADLIADRVSAQTASVGAIDNSGSAIATNDNVDLSGNALTDSTQGYIDLTGDGNDVRMSDKADIEDETGAGRFSVQSEETVIRDNSGNRTFLSADGFATRVEGRAGQPVRIQDNNGGYTAVEYQTSASTPGTLELTNALLNYTVNVSGTNDSMTANPETDTESGYITVEVNGTQKQIPVYDP